MLPNASPSKMRSFARIHDLLSLWLILTMIIAIQPLGFAGGSVGWTEVIGEITKDDPLLAGYITEHFDVAPSGGAIRVGHGKEGNSLAPPHEVGERIPPYHFRAKPKGVAGDFTLLLTLEPLGGTDKIPVRWQLSLVFIKAQTTK